MDALKKWMIIRFTPYQITTLPETIFSQIFLFKSSLLLNGKCGIQVYVPQTTATTSAFSSVLILLLCCIPRDFGQEANANCDKTI